MLQRKIVAMKKIFYLLLLLFPSFVYAQYPYTFKDISGKWIERTRTDKNSDVAPFKDTLYLEIRENGFMLVRHTIGATFYGDAELVDNTLSIQKEQFKIESAENGILKLKQGKVTHRFVKFEEFTDAPVVKMIPGAEKGNKPNKEDNLQGKWTVYKKTDPSFSSRTFYIKILDIKEKLKPHTYAGSVTFHNMDSIYNSDAIITIQDTEITILSNDKIIKAHMLKNDGEEFIIEHNSVQYFMKRFGK